VIEAMSSEQHAALVRRMYEILDRRELDSVDDVFDASWTNSDPALPPLSGHAGARQLISLLTDAFSGFTTTVDEIIAEDDWVAARVTHRGTHSGSFMNIPATGRSAEVGATGFYRVKNGKLIENDVIFDTLGLLRQLGVIPEPAAV
jgi:steroid delta-isomerase-like uncharacterized protein